MRLLSEMALVFAGAIAWGQMNTAEIGGSVLDQTGAALPTATIVIQQEETKLEFTTTTNSRGEYLFAEVPVGTYSLVATALNFRRASLERLELHAGDRLRRNFVLEIGDSTEVVTIEADPGGVELESAEIRDVVGPRQVTDLPLKGRQYLDLAMLSEGVVRPPGGTRGDAMQQAGTLVNVLGQRSGHNLYLLDGVAVTDEHFNNMVIAPSIDAIQELSIQKTSYAPEFGGKSGAIINVITKSGSNDFHSSLFEFVRNGAFDAKNFFDSSRLPIPPFRQNQFGATWGGPIIKNKTFLFLSYEGQRVQKSLTQTFSVPTAAMRQGDFSGLPAIYDPTLSIGGERTPFPGNQIPQARLDRVAEALLAHVPLPNLAGMAQNLRATGLQNTDTNQASARIDHQFSAKDTSYFRASVFDAREADPFGSGVLQESLLPGFGRDLSTHALNGAAGWTRAMNTGLVNEARFGVLVVVGGQTSPNAGNPFATQNGLAGVVADPRDAGYPQVSFGGQFTTIGDPALFTFRRNRDFEGYDNLIWHRGRHTVRVGAYIMHYDLEPVNPNAARGIFSFTPRWTSSAPGLADGSAFADFLLGYPTIAQAGLGRAAIEARTNWLHFYVQDSWQIAANLRLEIGVRYEYNQNMTDSGNQMAAIDTSVPGGRFVVASDGSGRISQAAKALLASLPVPFVPSSEAGWDNSLLASRPLRLAPRAGLAWVIPGRLKTAVRAGSGIYPNQAAYSIVTNLAQNLPFFLAKTVSSSAVGSPPFTTEGALAADTVGTAGGNNLDHNLRIEYNEVWNLNFERELTSSTMLSLAYIGSRTVHADSATVLNVPGPGPGPIAPRRPIPQLSQISDIRWDGWAEYHAFTVSAKRRFSRGLMFDLNWTWSHSIDDASDPAATFNETNLPQNVYNRTAEKASSSFDHRHRVVASAIYAPALPNNASRWIRAVFGHWRGGANFTTQSGAPFTVNLSSDPANIGAGPAQRPNVVGNPNRGPHTPDEWFDTSVFSLPPLYTFGNASRNNVIGPGLEEIDGSLQKNIPLGENVNLQFRAEVYNLLNHPNFNIPNRIAPAANFGSISSAQDSRQLQFALKLAF